MDKKFYKYALALAIPNIVQQLFVNASQMVDNIMVGRLNEISIAGVTIVNQIFFVFTILSFGVAATGGIFITQYKGAHNKEKIQEVFRVVVLASIFMGIVFFVLLSLFPYQILGFFAKDIEVVNSALLFLKYIKITFLIYPISLAIGVSFRYYGYVRIAMYTSILAVITNIIFNSLLIYGTANLSIFGLDFPFLIPSLGVEGAGLATFIARIVECLSLIITMIWIKSPIKTGLFDLFRFEKFVLKDFVKKGAPLMSNEFLWSLGVQTLNVIYTQRISDNIAAMSISSVITNMIFIGMGGAATATSIIIGNSLGQNKFEQAFSDSKKLLKMGACLGLSLGLVVMILSFFITQIYNINPETLMKARLVIIVGTCFSWLYYLNGGLFFILRAGGDTRGALIMDAGYSWLIAIPIVLYSANFQLYLPIYYLLGQALDFIKLFIASKRYLRKRWLVNLTTHNEKMV